MSGERKEFGEDARVIVEVDAAVATVCLNRPAKKNALDLAMFDAIVAAGEFVQSLPAVRAVVLRGAGGCFCSGLDIQSVMADPSVAVPKLMDERVGPANQAQRVGWIWREVSVPVIAAIEGVAFGGGLQIAAGADIRLAHPSARVAVMEAKYGLIPDMGITKTLASFVRPDHLKELVWTGRVVEANEALELGIVTALVDDPVAAATEMARTIAGKSPHATRAAKAMLDQAPLLSTTDAFLLESDLQRPLLGSPNQMEAVMAAFERRDPNFVDVEG